MTLTLFGGSSEEDNDSITISIFRKEDEMPTVDAGDVVLLLSAKVCVSDSLCRRGRADDHVVLMDPTCSSNDITATSRS